uniref:PUA domain-containing protein n=1 Tax=Macrostomum lignano TaxID=282301 RepID=A0A1I8HPG7_9PLAT
MTPKPEDMDYVRFTSTHPRLYVDSLCGVAVLRGSDIFAGGVIGIEPGASKDCPVSVYACLEKFNAGFTKAYTGATRFLGNGLLVMERKQLLGDIHANSGVAVRMTQPLVVCPSFQSCLFQSGNLVAQNLPSLVCARVLDAQPGQTVLDMCCAPGGKCLHLADLMQLQTLASLTVSRRIVLNSLIVFSWMHPAALWDSGLDYSRHQTVVAIKLVKPGGFLVYSTCTTRPEENERQVSLALQINWPNLKLVEQTPNLRPFGINQPDGSVGLVQKFDPEEPYEASDVTNACNYDTIGFFVAKFVVA